MLLIHLYNVIIKDLETNKYSEEPKTALVRLIFKKNERNKIGNYSPVNIVKRMSIFMRDVFTITLLSKQYYQISYQLIKNPILQIMSYTKLEKIPRH